MASVWALGTCPLALLQGSLWPFFFLLHVARLRLLNDGQALLVQQRRLHRRQVGQLLHRGGRGGPWPRARWTKSGLFCPDRQTDTVVLVHGAVRGDGGAATVAEYLEHGAH